MGHARAIISLENIEQQLNIYRKILKDGLSVRKVEELVRKIQDRHPGPEEKTNQNSPGVPYEIRKIQDKLSSHFGTRVIIRNDQENKGDIKIPYASHEDLNRILEILDL